MYGAQTPNVPIWKQSVFENDVEMYGAQTVPKHPIAVMRFENDVEMYGAQTLFRILTYNLRLRMM